MTDFEFTELLPIDHQHTGTAWRRIASDGIRVVEGAGRRFVEVDTDVLRLLTREAFRDISHLLRSSHLQQLRNILDDPEASPNDRFVATDLLKNAVHLGRGRAPDVPGHRHRHRHGQEG